MRKDLKIEGIRHLQKCNLDYIKILVEKIESALKLL